MCIHIQCSVDKLSSDILRERPWHCFRLPLLSILANWSQISLRQEWLCM